jgi:2-isopropylmalate synthase
MRRSRRYSRSSPGKIVLEEFLIQAITGGSDDVGKVHMQIMHEQKIYYGFGVNTDIITASVEAYLDAINKIKNHQPFSNLKKIKN